MRNLIQAGERRSQFQCRLSHIIHDDSFNNLAQQPSLSAVFKAIIHDTDLRDNFQCSVKILDVHLLLSF